MSIIDARGGEGYLAIAWSLFGGVAMKENVAGVPYILMVHENAQGTGGGEVGLENLRRFLRDGRFELFSERALLSRQRRLRKNGLPTGETDEALRLLTGRKK
jgi:hypothetical protein